jgi:Flp pilus assembly protein TadD
MEGVFDLYMRGQELLASGDHHSAVVPLTRARNLAPAHDSIREALGRALFRSRRYEEALVEFQAVAEHAPTNHFALFCAGRSLQILGRHEEACHSLARAAALEPGRGDYAHYRDRARARAFA